MIRGPWLSQAPPKAVIRTGKWHLHGGGSVRQGWGSEREAGVMLQKEIGSEPVGQSPDTSLHSPCGGPGSSDWLVPDVINVFKVLLKVCSAGKQTPSSWVRQDRN